MPRAVDSRWFALADLGCAGAAAGLCVLIPNLGWAALVLGVVPWGVRLAVGRPLFRRTRLDAAIAALVATAFVAVWTAYDRQAAWTKLEWLMASVLVYYALAGQPVVNHGPISAGFVAGAVLLAGLTLGDSAARAAGSSRLLSPAAADGLASLLSLLFPFCLVAIVASRRAGRSVRTWILVAVGFLAAVGLLASGERSTWVAALAAALCLFLCWLVGERAGRRDGSQGSARRLWGRILAVAAAIAIAVIIGVARPAISEVMLDVRAAQRFEMDRNTLRLAADFWITGGGLAAFPGLYSRYVLLIPVLFSPTSHNLYLDVLTEQGAGGLLAATALMAGSAWLLVSRRKNTVAGEQPSALLRYATLASITAWLVTGLLEDPLYVTPGLVLWLLPAGMAVSLAAAAAGGSGPVSGTGAWVMAETRIRSRRWIVGTLASVVLAFAFYRPLISMIWSNLGSVTLARQELAGWPEATTQLVDSAEARALARLQFDHALTLNPGNETAQYRIGLMAMDARDFSGALAPLRAALAGEPEHRGIRKALAYDLTWLGLPDQSQPLFTGIAEAPQELGVYSWWWGTQGRPDLAALASQMAARLQP